MKLFKLSLILGLLLALVPNLWAEERAVEVFMFSDSLIDENPSKYAYAYPEGSSSIEIVKDQKYEGKASLKITLDPTTYSGVAIGNYPLADLTHIRRSGALEFYIKGAEEGERFEVMLLGAEDLDGTKCEIGLVLTPKYVQVTKNWQKVSVPLAMFSDVGQYWDGEKIQPDTFDWNEFKEVKFNIRPIDKNKEFTIYVDEIKIVR